MISIQSIKSNDPSYSSSYDSPETERRHFYSPTSGRSAECVDRCKLQQLVTFLDKQNQRLQNELAIEKQRRNEELSLIIKSLIRMESKLKVDKKLINQRILKSDTEICRLLCLNRVLRKKLNEIAVTKDECFVLEALQCNTCRKKFYAIETKDNWSQTIKDGILLNDHPTSDNGSSSDDTVSSSFYGARRCVRYTSKRTFGTFRDYMHSRSMNIDDNFDSLAENASTISCDDSQKRYEKINIYSSIIDKLHGVKRVSSIEGDHDSEYDNSSYRKTQSLSSGVEEENVSFNTTAVATTAAAEDIKISSAKIELSPYSSKTNSLSRSKDFLETPPKHKFELSTDNWYASASDGEDDQGVKTNMYGSNVAVNPVLECVNQILLQQSMEEPNNDCQLKPFDVISNKSSSEQGNTGSISRKRVHFSTKNSMAHVPRNSNDHEHLSLDVTLQLSSPNKPIIADQIKDNILNYESIYSNEYEPIGSENNSSNLYVDMESKLSPDDRISLETKHPKQPPALPPKPANLLKFPKAFKVNELNESKIFETPDDKSVSSEPDYCSISEVNAASTFVQVVADVHKELHFENTVDLESLPSDKQSPKTDEIEQIFANIPKLSTFAATITTKPTHPKINYPIKSRHDEVISKSQRSPRQFKRKHVPNILAEINKRMSCSFPTTPTKSINSAPIEVPHISTPPHKSQSPLIKSSLNSSPVVPEKHLPIQAEFDWYNLDAEYGKSSSNHPDVICAANDANMIDKKKDVLIRLQGVEYNLDEEFSLPGSPDEIKSNDNESLNPLNEQPGSPKTVSEEFPIITETTPCFRKKTASFDKFIDSSGLSTKPLPRQRKIYFAGPFV
ncbi:uncharacterized protein LOC129949555 [Eupeodes corollae]|uniref:uncharacterized protein LOC129949555 n=1 Tax=Eupeodes corollae TaxID=290404 RepID=UPI002490CBB4|nr:uncharacterized protein LOC129949555 [Eupeodes corollae]XP_055917062.1 uncharacterized protein LOC129949555 [Eupeodes corollae]XP_055917063.1 uncharacterized protein LOC129949555 [Eupeodes corollae]XP_055917064.1 uncharacterized protein LOC129949555 [Eupeodes corollae]XP_055917065.1 uncharacterized protein LOC129949555 [Eupeodes corollae]XP_055917066.1 uncharacterized protein LOC129949555 [Eupeodes corollae]XP_055917067.1 uncharacterized protein LOC129949555 [Eupeodes corollae]XP_05591706